jgi:hypothetical protein
MPARIPAPTGPAGTAPSPDKPPSNRIAEGNAMPRPTEILFVDPGVADLATLLGSVRPGVEAIELDARAFGTAPIGRQIFGPSTIRPGISP